MNSQRVTENLMVAICNKSPFALAVQDAWRFSSPITTMSREDIDALEEKCRVVYTFKRGN